MTETKGIEGKCPYCDSAFTVPIADELPAYERMRCSKCNQMYWLVHSVIDPRTHTLADFEDRYIVDDITMTIEPRPSKLEEKAAEKLAPIQERLAPGTPGRCLCGGIILADTEEWKTPRCWDCFVDLGSPEKEPIK